jgi:hypothetical protein
LAVRLSLDLAIGIINAHQYGNGASIYTQNGYYARKFKMEAEAGMIGLNVGIPVPVLSLPFGGMMLPARSCARWTGLIASLPPCFPQSLLEEKLNLRVDAPEFVGSPFFEGCIDRGIES